MNSFRHYPSTMDFGIQNTWPNNTTNNWIIQLTAREESLAELKIKSGIFQGDFLSPLLFTVAIITTQFDLTKY